MNKSLLLVVSLLASIALSVTPPNCPSIAKTKRVVIRSADFQVALDPSFFLVDITLRGARGVVGYSFNLRTAVLAVAIPLNRTSIRDTPAVRESLRSFGPRYHPRPLVGSPVVTFAKTWDGQTTQRAQYGLDTDAARAADVGIKHRMNCIASNILGEEVSPLSEAADLIVSALSGFVVDVETAIRGPYVYVLLALSPASNGRAQIAQSITTGSAHARSSDSVSSVCETVPAGVPRSVDVLFYTDTNAAVRPYRRHIGSLVKYFFNSLDNAGIRYAAGIATSPADKAAFTTATDSVGAALRAFDLKPTTGASAPKSDTLAVVFIGDTDDFASAAAAEAHFASIANGRDVVYVGILCPDGTRCRRFAGDSMVTRDLIRKTGGSVAWLIPTGAIVPALSAAVLDIAIANTATRASMVPIASSVRVRLPEDSTVGDCNWASVPRSVHDGFTVVGKSIAFFGTCALKPTVTQVAVAYEYYGTQPQCVPSPEVCDGKDNDCDGLIDEGFDNDGDGYTTCSPGTPTFDCDDSDKNTYPSAFEVCDGKDNNCDGIVDEGCAGPGSPYTVTSAYTVDCAAGTTSFSWTVGTSTSILTSVSIPLPSDATVVSPQLSPSFTRTATGLTWSVPLGIHKTVTLQVVLGGIATVGKVNAAIDGAIPALIEVDGPVSIATFDRTPAAAPKVVLVPATLRDLPPTHPDVEGVATAEPNLVAATLGADGTPLLTAGDKVTVRSNATFFQWFHPSAATVAEQTKLVFVNRGGSPNLKFVLEAAEFYPLDGRGLCKTSPATTAGCYPHNAHFTVTAELNFRYRSDSDAITVTSDDDAWLFVDGKLALDIGGVHTASAKTVQLSTLNLAIGSNHVAQLFYADRRAGAATLVISIPPPEWSCETKDFCGVCDTKSPACPGGMSVDTDGDKTPDCYDICPTDPKRFDATVPLDCPCGTPDSDGDKTADCNDGCPSDPLKLVPGICGCGKVDSTKDTDNDGRLDCVDSCPEDPTPDCSCPLNSTDTDGDRWPDCIDNCPNDPMKADPKICGCGTPETDTDGDKTLDCLDKCPTDPLKNATGICGCGKSDTLDGDGDGTPDCIDECPADSSKSKLGQCGCGTPDVDTDKDGTPDCKDECPGDANKIVQGPCGCGRSDIDSDGDKVPDCNDGCPSDPKKTTAGQCGCGYPDTDTDGDKTADCKDGCPSDPLKVAPGQCNCGTIDTDSDGDTTADCNDPCLNNRDKVAPGECGCDRPDVDVNGDGKMDCGCTTNATLNLAICGCNPTDTDTDGDKVLDCDELCPSDPLKVAPGLCGCGVPDTDTDKDGVPDCNDKCPTDPNKTVTGVCGCFAPETDRDKDGTPDCVDQCPTDPYKNVTGICGCFWPDVDNDKDGYYSCYDECEENPRLHTMGTCGCDDEIDTDGDKYPDCIDVCPNDPRKNRAGICGCGVPDVDTDGDKFYDCQENCPLDPKKQQPGLCGCGVVEVDTDGDKVVDCVDGCPNDPYKNASGVCGCGKVDVLTDSDNDGVPDCVDQCPGSVDRDYDGDKVADCVDECPSDPTKTKYGRCGCHQPDIDSDGDGYYDCEDLCPFNKYYWMNPLPCLTCNAHYTNCRQLKSYCYPVCGNNTNLNPDVCNGCPPGTPPVPIVFGDLGTPPAPRKPEPMVRKRADPAFVASVIATLSPGELNPLRVDSDGDGTPDCFDLCPMDPKKTAPGECGCGNRELDSDGDGMPDCHDACPLNPKKIAPMYCGCDSEDVDSDGDGTHDCWDRCPNDPVRLTPNICGCGVAETDSDGDGRPDCKAPARNGAREAETGITTLDPTVYCADCLDKCPNDPNKATTGQCGCGKPDIDSDGDKVADCTDSCPNDYRKVSEGVCGCSVADVDSDRDGTRDCLDGCPTDPYSTAPSSCGCGFDEYQCKQFHRKSTEAVSNPTDGGGNGLPAGMVAVIVAAVAVVAVGVAGAAAFVAVIHVRRSRAAARGPAITNEGNWQVGTRWQDGQY